MRKMHVSQHWLKNQLEILPHGIIKWFVTDEQVKNEIWTAIKTVSEKRNSSNSTKLSASIAEDKLINNMSGQWIWHY